MMSLGEKVKKYCEDGYRLAPGARDTAYLKTHFNQKFLPLKSAHIIKHLDKTATVQN